ncbi:ABC transporter substrate-binding protein [Phycicoccus sp. HDW14]|uniref:ABC transporter substrate-binding protein n=1 Tax=Phycicoccus sp. HDW14 TaxID=2714941 RepID=UPI00140D024D|nr:ABC transporter substrate-binding protein [Phycicoccus sp. HDW14]QIM20967.1 ABC transporter substrate-binding protein [Phycicoccus sp. HDW14]
MRPRTAGRATVAVVCAAVLTTAGCSSNGPSAGGSSAEGAPVSGGTLNMLGSGDVDYMDPNASYYSTGYTALRMWSRQLFTYPAVEGKTTTAVPDLAEAVPTEGRGISADGKTYTITLRDGAMWDTEPARAVTAGDFVRGVKRTCNPVQPFGGLPDYESLIEGFSAYCAGFAKVQPTAAAIAAYVNGHDVAGLQAPDDRTVVIRLTKPASYLVDMMTLPAFSPAPKEWDAYVPASAELAQHTISDGPYRITAYTPTKSISFERNPAWRAASDPIRKAYVDKVQVNETVSQDSTQQQLETGTPNADMQFDNLTPPSRVPALAAKKDPNLNIGSTASSNPYIVYNTVSPNNGGALGKPEVRRAISTAIDRSNIIQVLGGNLLNTPLAHVLPGSIVGGEKAFDDYPNDPAKAKQMLAAAGYPDGLTLKVLYRNASEGQTKTFQTIQQDLGKVGITVVGVPSPNADFYTKYLQVPTVARRGVWDVSIAGWGPDWYGNAALSFFGPLFNGKAAFPPIGSNFGFYENPALDALVAEAAQAPTPEEAAPLWAEADHLVMEDAAFFPITEPRTPNYHATQVHGAVYIPAFQNFDPTNVWLAAGMQGG